MRGDGVYKHKGSPVWQIAFQVMGRRISETSGTTSREEAVLKAQALREQKRAEIEAENAAGPKVTFDQAAYRYWKKHEDPRPFEELSLDERSRQTEKFDALKEACILVCKTTPCAEVDTARMIDIRQKLRASPARTATKRLNNAGVNRKMSLIFAVLNVAKDHMGCPLPLRPRMKEVLLEEDERDLVISYEDEARICAHLPADHHAAFAFELETGLRRGDIVKLRFGRVDFEAKTVKGRRRSKGNKLYPVPLNKRALAILEEMRQITGGGPDDLVFTRLESRVEVRNGVPTTVVERVPIGPGDRFGRVIKKALIAAGLADHHFHDMRRTAGTRYYLATRDYEATRRFLGHRSIDVTKRYIKVALAEVARGAELMDEMRGAQGWHLGSAGASPKAAVERPVVVAGLSAGGPTVLPRVRPVDRTAATRRRA